MGSLSVTVACSIAPAADRAQVRFELLHEQLEPVDALIVPDDLESALRRSKRAREAYDALSKTDKRSMLYSLYSAKREATRAKRLAQALEALERR